MIKEVSFGTPIKLGKAIEMSWHSHNGKARWSCEYKDGGFVFTDSKEEYGQTIVGKENVKYFILEKVDLETSTHLEPVKRGRKANDKQQA